MRAWVEISSLKNLPHNRKSRPPCEGVGRNLLAGLAGFEPESVALHVRAWVEIISNDCAFILRTVALHVRAWVEMIEDVTTAIEAMSRPPCEGVGRNPLRVARGCLSYRSPSM